MRRWRKEIDRFACSHPKKPTPSFRFVQYLDVTGLEFWLFQWAIALTPKSDFVRRLGNDI
ncbi:hypothetical protein DFR29_1256 [Tahibacter aquaticus]|uniref:Uncharacterized protein n=1 Tax=Tahibacter aquaticus TaxID=520092 RepID=A0A4R6YJX3_9GAMM|nr:hypothetical protein DFR29_1256 [Tahibacter aquaticus]